MFKRKTEEIITVFRKFNFNGKFIANGEELSVPEFDMIGPQGFKIIKNADSTSKSKFKAKKGSFSVTLIDDDNRRLKLLELLDMKRPFQPLRDLPEPKTWCITLI